MIIAFLIPRKQECNQLRLDDRAQYESLLYGQYFFETWQYYEQDVVLYYHKKK